MDLNGDVIFMYLHNSTYVYIYIYYCTLYIYILGFLFHPFDCGWKSCGNHVEMSCFFSKKHEPVREEILWGNTVSKIGIFNGLVFFRENWNRKAPWSKHGKIDGFRFRFSRLNQSIDSSSIDYSNYYITIINHRLTTHWTTGPSVYWNLCSPTGDFSMTCWTPLGVAECRQVLGTTFGTGASTKIQGTGKHLKNHGKNMKKW